MALIDGYRWSTRVRHFLYVGHTNVSAATTAWPAQCFNPLNVSTQRQPGELTFTDRGDAAAYLLCLTDLMPFLIDGRLQLVQLWALPTGWMLQKANAQLKPWLRFPAKQLETFL